MTGSPCASCKWFNVDVQDRDVCEAFPDGIPSEILLGLDSHRVQVEGDNDLTWVPKEGFEWMDVPSEPLGSPLGEEEAE